MAPNPPPPRETRDVTVVQPADPQATALTGEAPHDAFALRVIDVKKRFGEREVLRGVSVDVKRGSILVILGGSGMGKSVLMKHMIGLLHPDSGQVLVDGEDLAKVKPLDMKRVRQKYGMVFQNGALFDSMTNWDNIAFPLREHRKDLNGPALEARVRELFALFSLNPELVGPRFPSEISGGQRKRVALARSVALEPSIVLYDEPTTGLDPITTDQVDEMILEAKAKLGVTSIVISHDIASAFKIADDIIFVYDGQIIVRGHKDDMLRCEHPFVQQFFNTWRVKNG